MKDAQGFLLHETNILQHHLLASLYNLLFFTML